MGENVEIITVDASNVDKQGFFCYKSKKKTEGYRGKLAWLKQRFSEGMQIKMLVEDGRSVGFIEYIPGEFAWRAVNAADYRVIHCLWVVGKAKGKGYGKQLLNACIEDARQSGAKGVVMVASSGNWLAKPSLFLSQGFEVVDQAPPSFSLLVKRFDESAPLPTFPIDWEARLAHYGEEFTILYTPQCPYNAKAIEVIADAAATFGLKAQVVELQSAQEVQSRAPSAYGTFNVVYKGELVAYHWIGEKELRKFFASNPL